MVSAGLEQSGVTAWAGQLLIGGAGTESRTRLLLLTMLLVALLTALISVNGAVAALLPVVVVMAVRLKRAPSQLLMPLVFSAHAGSLLALTGTPVNVLVYNAAIEAGLPGFASSSSRWQAFRCWPARWRSSSCSDSSLLPESSGRSLPSDFSKHARTLVEQYGLSNGLFRMRVKATSPLAGRSNGRRLI